MSNRLTGFERSTGGSGTLGGPRPPMSAPPPRRHAGARAAVLLAFVLSLGAIALGPGAGAQLSQTASSLRPVWVVASSVGLATAVYRSTDGAEHWVRANNGLPRGGGVDKLAATPSAPQIAYAASPTGLYKTTDGGNSWRRLPCPGGCRLISIDPTRPQVIYSVNNRGLLRSRDGGEHWQNLRARFCEPRYRRRHCSPPTFLGDQLLISPRNPRVMYTNGGGGYFVVWKSTDGGRTWRPPISEACLRRFCGPAHDLFRLAMDPRRPSVLFAVAGDVYKTRNAGRTWTKVKKLRTAGTVAVDPKHSKVVYAATSAGVSKSTNGGRTWVRKLRRALYGGEDGLALAIDPDTTSTVYVASQGGVLKTSNGGATWAPKNEGLPGEYREGKEWVSPLVRGADGWAISLHFERIYVNGPLATGTRVEFPCGPANGMSLGIGELDVAPDGTFSYSGRGHPRTEGQWPSWWPEGRLTLSGRAAAEIEGTIRVAGPTTNMVCSGYLDSGTRSFVARCESGCTQRPKPPMIHALTVE